MTADILAAARQTSILGTKFLRQVVPAFAVGAFAAQLLVELGWLGTFSWLARPLMRFGRLHPECGASFIVTLVSPTAGHSMLAEYRHQRRLGGLELIVAAVVNNLPGEIATSKSLLPVVVPALGVFGLAYYGILLCAAAIKAVLMLLLGRTLLPRPEYDGVHATADTPNPHVKLALRNALRTSSGIIFRVLKTMIPTAYAAAALITCGVFDKFGTRLGILARYFPVTGTTLPVMAARLLSPIGAYTMAGSLFAAKAASGRELVFSLVVGALLSTGTNLRYLIPYYCGIFGPRSGAKVIGASIAARIVSFAIVLAGMSVLWK